MDDHPVGPLPPLTDQDYSAVKGLLADVERIESDYREKSGHGFDEAESTELRGVDEYLAVLRAAAEGYEAAHRG